MWSSGLPGANETLSKRLLAGATDGKSSSGPAGCCLCAVDTAGRGTAAYQVSGTSLYNRSRATSDGCRVSKAFCVPTLRSLRIAGTLP
jgi:hypothetical protein